MNAILAGQRYPNYFRNIISIIFEGLLPSALTKKEANFSAASFRYDGDELNPS